MKVVHVVRQFAPAVGGLEEAVLKLCGALQVRGIEVAVVTLDRIARAGPERLPRSDAVGGIPVSRIPFTGSWRYPLAPAVLAQIGDADIVHVHAVDFFFDFLALTRWAHGKPLVASTHGGFFHTAFAARLKRLYFQTLTRASAKAYARLCASSRSDFELFEPIAAANLVLAENGVDTGKWAGRSSPEPMRSLVAIGRFASHKGLDRLFPLLAALRRLDEGWRLTIAGRPWDVTADTLRAMAHGAGVAAAVDILVDPDDAAVGACIGSASYIVSPSAHEGFGIGVVEGMAAGLEPLLSAIPPFRQLTERTGCGRIVAFDAPEQAARQIEDAHRAGTADAAARRDACMAAAALYGWPRAAERFASIYADVLDARPARPTALARDPNHAPPIPPDAAGCPAAPRRHAGLG